jgi:hypothetical protein
MSPSAIFRVVCVYVVSLALAMPSACLPAADPEVQYVLPIPLSRDLRSRTAPQTRRRRAGVLGDPCVCRLCLYALRC